MNKLLTFILTALLAFGVGWAAEETFVFSELGYSNGDVVATVEGTNVTLSFNKGSNTNAPKYYTTGLGVRCYGGNYFTVSSTQTITGIVLTFGTGDGSNAITTDVETYSNGTWTGSASSVKFSIGGSSGHRRISKITVTYSSGSAAQTCAAPEFSLEAGTYFGTQNVTITCETAGASIYYTTDGTDPSATNGTLYSGPVAISTSTSLKAIVVMSDHNDSGITSAYYNIIPGSSIFRKVTSPNQLVGGRKYIIVYPGTLQGHSEIALMGPWTGSNNYCSYVTDNGLAINDDKIDISGYDAMILTLGGTTGAWTFKVDDSNYLAWGGSSTYLSPGNDPNSANAQWVVNSSGSDYWITNVGSMANNGTPRSVIANVAASANPLRFACYTTVNSTQGYALLFYQYEGADPASLTVSPATLPIGVSGGDVTVYASDLTQDLAVTVTTGFSATPGTLSADGSYPATVNVTYTGQALGATGEVTIGNTADNLSETVDVSYTYDGSMYLVGDLNNTAWSFDGIAMTRDAETGIYSVNVTAQAGNGGQSWFYFTTQVGDAATAQAHAIGPQSNDGTWWLNPEWYGQPFAFGTTGGYSTINMSPGSYLIQVNPADNTFTIMPSVADPVISPATGVYREPQTVSITCSTPGATIYYTIDGSTPTTSSPVYSGEFTVGSTTTIKAIAVSNGITSNPVEALITIKALSNSYVLVTNTTDVVANDDYVLVYSRSQNDTDYAMSNTYNESSLFYSTVTSGFTLANETVTLGTASTVNVLTLEDAGSGKFYIKDDAGNYLYYSSGNTVSRSSTPGGDAYKWTITINGSGDASIQNVGTTARYLQANWNGSRYACYQTSSTIPNAKLYKSGTPIPSIEVTPADALDLGTITAGGTQTSATFTVRGYNLHADDVVTLHADNQYFTVSPATISAADAMAGDVTVTVTYFGSDYEAHATVTIASQRDDFEDETLSVTAHRQALAVTITPVDGSTFMGPTVYGMVEANVADATIEYSFDGINWMPYDPDEGFSASVDYVGGEVTVYARARYNGETSAVAQVTYTRVGKATTCTAEIVFAPTSDNGGMTSWSTLQGHIGQGADYVSSAQVGNVYTSKPYSAMRFGTASSLGHLALTLDLSKFEGGACKLSKVTINAARYNQDTDNCALNVSTDVATDGVTRSITTGQNDFADYVFNFDGSEVTTLTIGNVSADRGRVYVHSITLEYNCGAAVEAPGIVPASGTYYENQTVTITGDGNSTIYYTTDGSDPLTSETRQEYNGPFEAVYTAGGTQVIKAVAIDEEDNVSEMTTVTYAWGVPSVNIVPGSTNVTEPTTIAVTITDKGADDAVIHYTTDGTTPTIESAVYNGPIDVVLNAVGDAVTVKAIVVSGGYTSSAVTATYQYVENTVEMIDPYFSPISNHTYYGDQTVEILCPIPGAIMYYEMAQASGTEAPAATAVTQPSRSSSQYGTPIMLTEGNSYYIKAVAYVGNSVSHIVEGWYTILPTSEWTGPDARVLESVSELQNVSSSTEVTFRNPVQVVYMSLFTNDSTPTGYGNPIPEFCYVRDNTGYGLIYFGKGATEWAEYTSGRTNSPATFYKMGDWIDGSQIVGTTGTWTNGLIPQLGTNSHVITSWPASAIGHTRIMAEETTCRDINAANTVQNNMCGHYVHLRNTTVNWSQDNNPTASDPDYRNFGRYTDGTATASMYDRFWLFSGYGQTYTYHNDDYTLKGVGDYNTDFFNYYQSRGATFDIFAIGAYYNDNYEHDGETGFIGSEILPIDYLWIYPPRIVTPSDAPYEREATIVIEGDTASWSNIVPTIYYRTDEMEDWAVYDPQNPPVITSSTTVYSYTELPAVKADGVDYSAFVHSPVVQRSYVIEGIDDPVISPASRLVDISDGPQTLRVTVTTGEGCNSTEGTYYTVYTTDGTEPYWHSADDCNGTIIEGVAGTFNSFNIDTTTTVTAVTYYVLDGVVELQSNVKSETYTFVKKNGVTYNILTDAPQVGTIVVVVNKAHNVAMSIRQNTTNRGSVGVIFTDESKDVVYGNDEIAQFVVESAGANRYYLRNVNGDSPGYLYVNSSSANLLTESALDSEGKAASSINIGAASDNVDERYVATVTYAYEGVPRYLRYYDNGHAFSTYAHAGLHEDIFLYGIEATPLSFIEENKRKGDHVVVSDQLVGTWAVVDGDTKLLWVKDMDNRSIIPTYNDKQAVDYMMEYCGSNPQRYEWDQSNWAIIDFSKQSADPTTYVNKVIQGSTIVGTYSDELNYTITLDATSEGGVEPVAMADALGYHGYVSDAHGDPLEIQYSDYHYNQYTPVNFLEKNLNEPWGPGAKAGDNARAIAPGTPMFFMNPKIMEVAHVWAVYDGLHDGYHRFDVYENSGSYNGFDMEGSFDVLDWSYNRKDDNSYGMPGDLAEGKAYMFHVVVARQNFQYGHRNVAPMRGVGAMGSAASSSMGVYPLDLPSGNGGLTAVTEVQATKEVESVRFYNLMGVESEAPFDGINIVVTRYTDGSISSCKIMR